MLLASLDVYASGSYVPILILLILAGLLAAGMVALSRFVGRRISYPEKFITYESGMQPKGDARERFSIKFYVVAILFIIFDIEVVFLYPWAVQFKELGLLGLVEMGLFLLVLLVGYLYILGSGALKWERSAGEDSDD